MNLKTIMSGRPELCSFWQRIPSPPGEEKLSRRFRLLVCLYCLVWLAWFTVSSAHWQLVNDPAQFHYVCFLIGHGMAPYRDILEINMPGTYLVNWSVMHTLGTGSTAWRMFDLSLMAVAAWAMIVIARPYEWLAGALSATLFVLYHGKEGAGQQGQRDLVIAVLLLCAYAFLFQAFRTRRPWPMLAFGLCAGVAVTIKPLPLPFIVLLLVAAAMRWRRLGEPILRPLLYAFGAFLIPMMVVGAFLVSERALGPFWYLLHVELPFYQRLARLPLLKMVRMTMSGAVATLALLALAIAVAKRELWNWETTLLFAGVLFGAVSFIAQGKGLPYHRDPMFAFLFPWAALQFLMFLRAPGVVGGLAKAGLGFALILLPICARVAARRVWAVQYGDSLAKDLDRLGGARLSGHVQCFDMPADCDATLYQMRLVQSTGLFYDYLIFGSAQQPVIREQRQRFWQQFARNRPTVLVVGKGLFPYGGGFEKLESWPLLQQEIAADYSLYDERTFPRADAGERAYRIYVDKRLRASQNP